MTDDKQPDRPAAEPSVPDDRPDRPAPDRAVPERAVPVGRPDPREAGAAPDVEDSGERAGAGRRSTLGDFGMPAAGRRPAAEHTAQSEQEVPDPYAPLDPHAPLSPDGPTVRLAGAVPPPATGADASLSPTPSDQRGAEPAGAVAAGDEGREVSRPDRHDDEATTLLTPPAALAEADDASWSAAEPPAEPGGQSLPDAPRERPAEGDDQAWAETVDGGPVAHPDEPWLDAVGDPAAGHRNPPWVHVTDQPWEEPGDDLSARGDDHSWSERADGLPAERHDETVDGHAGGPPAARDGDTWSDTAAGPPASRDDRSWGGDASLGEASQEPAADASLDRAVEPHRWQGSPAGPDRWPDTPSRPAGDPAGHDDPVRPDERADDPAGYGDRVDDPAGHDGPARHGHAAERDDHLAESVSATTSAGHDTPERGQESMARAAAASDVRETRGDSHGGSPKQSPEQVTAADGRGAAAVPDEKAPGRRLSPAGALIWLLLALLGFTLAVQLRSNDQDAGLATARQEDLVGILSDLEARDQRLQQEIAALEESQRQLTSGVAGRQAALAEAGKRADELGLLSGTLPARGPGLKISIDPKGQPIKASAILNAVQELRGAGGEVMEIIGDNGVAVRIVASSYFVDGADGQVIVDGKQLSGPYTLWVIGVPATMQTALQIPGGVVASVSQAGGNVTMEQRTAVEVTAVRQPTSLQYARPVS